MFQPLNTSLHHRKKMSNYYCYQILQTMETNFGSHNIQLHVQSEKYMYMGDSIVLENHKVHTFL